LATMGYNRISRSDYNVLFGVTQGLDDITRGLSFEGRIAYATTSDIVRKMQREGAVPSYHYNPADDSYTLSQDNRYTLTKYSLYAGNNVFDKRVNIQAYLNYDRTYGDHHIYSIALLNQNRYIATNGFNSNQLNVPEKFQGFTFKLGYEFQ